ncbi:MULTISPECIES: tyrosine-type recombinase/integrase [unclassified Xanthomonas]|uniref:tyrosine-type recombinase/integrase n=1 Tax=Xanthomonas sp. LMG 8992 TaxID=1591157 RepID=UPI00137226E3
MSALVREEAPLPDEVMELLPALPNGPQLPAQRAWLLAGDPRFAGVMRRVERRGLPARSLAELWLWLLHLTIDMASRPETTGQSYARTVARYLRWCAADGIDFERVGTADFDRWQRWLAIECRNGANWRAKQVQAVRNFYDWRRSRGLAESNLAADLTGPRIRPKPPKKYTEDQLRSLFRAIEAGPAIRAKRDRCVVLLLLATGMRREELATLQLIGLELTRRTGVVRIAGKGAKEREVPFEGPVVDAVRDWLEQRESLPFDFDREALFVTLTGPTRGQRLSLRGHETLIAFHAKEAKLREWGIHRFRVTFATQLYDDGADIETIRALMGHESIETTRRYLAVSERARRTRLSADRQHRVLGTKPTGTPLWARIASGELTRD